MSQPMPFLIRCLRAFLNPEETGALAAFPKEGPDWEAVLQLAAHHRVAPILYQGLMQQGPEGVPETVLEGLRTRFERNLRRNLRLTAELLEVLELFQAHGVRVIPYKGPALAACLYENLASRQFADLDVLISRQDVLKAKELVLARGYRPLRTLNRAQEAALLRTNIEYVFCRESPTVSLDLHWRVDFDDELFSLDFEGLWRRRQPLSLAGRTVAHLDREDLLLILCLHAGRHMTGIPRLAWLCDIARMVGRHEDMDWDRLLSRAGAPDGRRLLFPVLLLAHELFAAPLPEEVVRELRRESRAVAAASWMKTLLCVARPGQKPDGWQRAVSEWRLNPGGRALGMVLRGILVPQDADWETVRLPARLYPLYYLLRPVRLTVKYAQRGANRVANRWRGS